MNPPTSGCSRLHNQSATPAKRARQDSNLQPLAVFPPNFLGVYEGICPSFRRQVLYPLSYGPEKIRQEQFKNLYKIYSVDVSMIDCHCHLEQKDYNVNREEVIGQCREELKAIITCCAHPVDSSLTLEIAKKHSGFVFCVIGLHPEFIKELSEDQIRETIKIIGQNKDLVVGIGEIGLDFHWIKEPEWQEKQKELFIRMIQLAKELNKPLVVHARSAFKETIDILEQQGMKNKSVLMHMFQDRKQLCRIIENGWHLSIGPGIARSKDTKKIARDAPLDRILLETDSPWFAQEGQAKGTPLNVKVACERIAEAKKISAEEVEKQTDLNTIKFFNLKIK